MRDVYICPTGVPENLLLVVCGTIADSLGGYCPLRYHLLKPSQLISIPSPGSRIGDLDISRAVKVAVAVNDDGKREVLGVVTPFQGLSPTIMRRVQLRPYPILQAG